MRLLFWFIALAALVIAVWLIWGGAWEQRFTLAGAVAWIEGAGPWAWAAGIGLLAADLVLPVPGTVVMSALGWVYGTAWGGLIASAGSILAGLFGYGVGRLIGEKGARKLLGDGDFEKGQKLFTKGGGWMIALSRAVPILPEALSCTAGLVRMPFGRFLASMTCGSLPVGFLYAWIGSVGRDAPAWAFGFSIGVPAILWLLASRLK
ncbi:VTT domain-containing protein [Haloferula sp. BvORR071]|uniref:TVP38/TMEM64 family protein n=1 Tax=Haloferula sp. BvORR071 TaxID=1396141 RepID=UPI0009DFD6D2|nr:VTT domain-containing protein [Haloferula sp. BvORR071]